MRNVIRYLMEPMLSQFFLVDSICDGFLDEKERRQIFKELGRVFCVPLDAETMGYFTAANAPQYRKIQDITAYERQCRIIQFAEASGQMPELTEVDRMILAQKRDALQIRAELFKQTKNLTMDTVAEILQNTAMNGNVDAMITLAFLEYHGTCITRDREGALKRAALCAQWNHLMGNLMMLAYGSGDKQPIYNTLNTVLRNANQREVFRYLCQAGGFTAAPEQDPVARILDKAFGIGVIRHNHYDSGFAKVAFSQLISTEDKKKLLLNKKQGAVASLASIPFSADRSGGFTLDREKSSAVVLPRPGELDSIFCGLSPVLNGRGALYRPLLVVGSDPYISRMYMDGLKRGFGDGSVQEIDGAMLTPQDFLSGQENFLLRGISQTNSTHTVFLVHNCDEIGDREQEELRKLLDHGYRRRFNLMDPTVSLDLSDVLMVLFASESNSKVRQLAEECDVVWTQPISRTEKRTVIETMFRQQAEAFGCAAVTMDPGCMEYLEPMGVEKIQGVIEGALKRAAYENAGTVTAQAMQMIVEKKNGPGSRREFGYLGGALHA